MADYWKDKDLYIKRAARHAAVCLLWQASDASEDGGNGYPIYESVPRGDSFHGEGAEYIDRVVPLIAMDVSAFVAANWEVLNEARVTASQCGHDIILTANGHGAGFWDRGLGDAGNKLTEATRGYSFDAEFELFGEERETDDHCADELAWLMVENTVIVDLIGASA
jgi:hypothetical protein